MNLKIKDGRQPTIADMRKYFESAVKRTAGLVKNIPLEVAEKDGVFDGYANKDADALWVGFAIGMRCSQRICDATFPELQLGDFVSAIPPEKES